MKMLLIKAFGLYSAMAIVSFIISLIGNVLGMGSIQFLFVFVTGFLALGMNCLLLYCLDSNGLLTNIERNKNG